MVAAVTTQTRTTSLLIVFFHLRQTISFHTEIASAVRHFIFEARVEEQSAEFATETLSSIGSGVV